MLALSEARGRMRRRRKRATSAPWTGCSPCNRRMAAGRRSMPTITGSSSTTFPSPITMPCSIRLVPISPGACWKRLPRTAWAAAHRRAARRRVAGSQAGAGWKLVWPLGRGLYLRHLFRLARSCGGRRKRSRSPFPRGGEWLRSVQNADGGWGESCASYDNGAFTAAPSTPSQTAWAILGLIAGGDTSSRASSTASNICSKRSARMEAGMKTLPPAPDSPKFSI